MTNEGVVAT